MLHDLLIIPVCFVCGFAYRIRGGFLHLRSGQLARLVWAISCAIAGYVGGMYWWHAILLIPAFWVTSTLPLFNAIDLGKNEGSYWGDFFLLMLRGLLTVILALPVYWYFGYLHWWVLIIGGLLMPVAYWVGRQLKVNIEDFGKGGDFPESGEMLFGMIIGSHLFFAAAT